MNSPVAKVVMRWSLKGLGLCDPCRSRSCLRLLSLRCHYATPFTHRRGGSREQMRVARLVRYRFPSPLFTTYILCLGNSLCVVRLLSRFSLSGGGRSRIGCGRGGRTTAPFSGPTKTCGKCSVLRQSSAPHRQMNLLPTKLQSSSLALR